MLLIALTGLVSLEKAQVAVQLAQQYTAQGKKVAVLDNIARMPMDAEAFAIAPTRINGKISCLLPQILDHVTEQVVIVAFSEMDSPDDISVALDGLRETHPHVAVRTITLIDTRTCDCFPQMRERFELYADKVLYLPLEQEVTSLDSSS